MIPNSWFDTLNCCRTGDRCSRAREWSGMDIVQLWVDTIDKEFLYNNVHDHTVGVRY